MEKERCVFICIADETENFDDAFAGSNWDIGRLTMAVYGGLW